MKTIITEAEVKTAMQNLANAGRKVTLAALHAALGNRGSMTTLVKIKAAIEKAEDTPEVSEEAQEAFRVLWAAGLEAGQKINDEELQDLKATVASISNENEALDAQCLAAQAKLAEMQEQVSSLVRQLEASNQERLALKSELGKVIDKNDALKNEVTKLKQKPETVQGKKTAPKAKKTANAIWTDKHAKDAIAKDTTPEML